MGHRSSPSIRSLAGLRLSGPIVISVLGSSGDCLPLIPLSARLRSSGVGVLWTANMQAAHLLRGMGERAAVLSSSRYAGFADDPRVVSTRFHGWASWRASLEHYVLPTLSKDIVAYTQWFKTVRPRAVVAVGLNPAVRTACLRTETRCINITFSPQLASVGNNIKFASGTRASVQATLGLPAESPLVKEVVWGAPYDAVLIDPILAGPLQLAGSDLVGYPYFDGRRTSFDLSAAMESIAVPSNRPLLLWTLGSAIGTRARHYDELIDEVCRQNRVSVLSVGLGPRSSPGFERRGRHHFRLHRIRLSDVLNTSVRGVIHHAGVGTAIGTIKLGLPSVAFPHAFDQPYVAATLQELGLAVEARTASGVSEAVHAMLDDESIRERTRDFASRLIPSDAVTDQLCSRILGLAD